MRESAVRLRGLLLRARSEEWLFDSAIRGDAVAFAEVYRRYHARIYGFCLSRLMDPLSAEEAAQETFVRFLDADSSSIVSPRPWLFGVARNVCLEVARQRAAVLHVENTEELLGSSPDSADDHARREQGRNIILALRRMRPRYRTALVLRELHGLSSLEMAEALNTTPGAVDTLVSRSRDAFGRAYAEVTELPEGCSSAYPLIYKQSGSGLSKRERERLEGHLRECESCRREASAAHRNGSMAAVLPLLTLVGSQPQPLGLAQVLQALDPAFSGTPYALMPSGTHVWARTAAALALAAAVVLPPATTSFTKQEDVSPVLRAALREDGGMKQGQHSPPGDPKPRPEPAPKHASVGRSPVVAAWARAKPRLRAHVIRKPSRRVSKGRDVRQRSVSGGAVAASCEPGGRQQDRGSRRRAEGEHVRPRRARAAAGGLREQRGQASRGERDTSRGLRRGKL